ncbi:MAG: hybrid sensor histidine kinase/response regulator [Deltaproteobacteria bacterium]|nr:hybrid sensor histidine kinase/response regulator [Deltaproteobacteria bacterium]
MKTTHPSGPASLRKETILIVDDEKLNLDLTSVLFRNRGFRVLTAPNAPDAIDLVGREQPEIVLLDYMMPGMDGFAALTEIRQRFPDTYVIMLTGRGNERIAVELMKAGASDYILKPFLNLDLLERVERVLKVRDMELRNRELMKERNRLLSEIESWNRELEQRVEEKSRELQKVQDEIIQTEKMSTVGYLSAGMAHEIRNPLNSIALYAQLLRGDTEEQDRLDCLEKIEQEVRRIDGILRKLMDAVKRPRFHIREVSVDSAIDSAIEMFRSRIEMHGIRVERDFRSIPPPLQADQTEIEQIFTNLIVNSIEEMPNGGVLGVVLDRHGHDVIVRISDTGRGIPPENISKIFDPFFTTKSSGTGLGLYVVLRIVKTYNGRIDVTSEDGKGTTFSVILKVPDGASR